MHILIINYEYLPIGAGGSNASWFLARALVNRGHRVSVVTSAFEGYRGTSVEDGVCVHRVRAWRKRIDRSDIRQMLCFAVSAMRSAPGIVVKSSVDRLFAFFSLPSGVVAYWLRNLFGIPYIIALRGGDVPGFLSDLDRTHRRVRWLRHRILASAQAIVANSQGLADLSRATDPFPVAVIPNGIDRTMFRPRGRSSEVNPDTRFEILFAGRIQEQKNLGLLLSESARLLHERAGGLRLHIAGDGPLRQNMSRHAERLGIGNHIVWHSWLTKPQLLKLYQRVDCFVNPSLSEGMPNAVLEAMACGLPVIASRIFGNDSLVEDRKTGLLFALEEPKQLGEALQSLMDDRVAARRMGAAGRARTENFSWESAASAYERLFENPRIAARS